MDSNVHAINKNIEKLDKALNVISALKSYKRTIKVYDEKIEISSHYNCELPIIDYELSKRISVWTERYLEDLHREISAGITRQQLLLNNELQKEYLEITLSLRRHDK